MDAVTLKQIGYKFSGRATLNLWDGRQGTIEMDSWITQGKFDRQKMIDGINDGQFGCESIEFAEVRIEKLFENGYTVFDSIIEVNGDELINREL